MYIKKDNYEERKIYKDKYSLRLVYDLVDTYAESVFKFSDLAKIIDDDICCNNYKEKNKSNFLKACK